MWIVSLILVTLVELDVVQGINRALGRMEERCRRQQRFAGVNFLAGGRRRDAGIGADVAFNGADASFTRHRSTAASQIIAGLVLPLTSRLDATLNYRALQLGGSGRSSTTVVSGTASQPVRPSDGTSIDSSIVVGLRDRF